MIYIMSDIHGRLDKYLKMLEIINFAEDDLLYILGDVIDRGKDGIKILQDIMKRKNIVFLVGNHEVMMYNYYYNRLFKDNNYDMVEAQLWGSNSNHFTHKEFIKLQIEEQVLIMKYIENSYVYISDLYFQGNNYYLVHASPSLDVPYKRATLLELKNIGFSITDLVWRRLKHSFLGGYGHKIVVVGHTSTSYFRNYFPDYSIYHDNGFIAIDCGCSREGDKAMLGCIRLDDYKEFYV